MTWYSNLRKTGCKLTRLNTLKYVDSLKLQFNFKPLHKFLASNNSELTVFQLAPHKLRVSNTECPKWKQPNRNWITLFLMKDIRKLFVVKYEWTRQVYCGLNRCLCVHPVWRCRRPTYIQSLSRRYLLSTELRTVLQIRHVIDFGVINNDWRISAGKIKEC